MKSEKALSHSCFQFFTNKEVKILVHQKLQCENSGTSQPCYLVTPVSLCPQGFLKPSWGTF